MAASTLIQYLTQKGDLYNAGRYAQATLDGLKDSANGVDQESEAVANGYFQLAYAIFLEENGELVRAEMLVRESLRIRTQLSTNTSELYLAESTSLLAGILQKQGMLGDEEKELLQTCLFISVKYEGTDSINAAIGNRNLGHFHQSVVATRKLDVDTGKEHLKLSLSFYEEALRIYCKVFGPDHQDTISAESDLSAMFRILSAI
jgi:hypothetical protein